MQETAHKAMWTKFHSMKQVVLRSREKCLQVQETAVLRKSDFSRYTTLRRNLIIYIYKGEKKKHPYSAGEKDKSTKRPICCQNSG